ncbi:cytosolic acyl coenzyme A thioester hydrolase [Pteropus vampyrus]|uniref:Cytosolic acyl coenzyme A thioester hydrolase n=1 Tax=Pteropus vampyrus TaxID=132908 RepID=A0A6P6CV84_PTEVA|nr:cytosolic acyl coenzyme A thioester hydrolase [Pteropus vampyrus]
MGENGSQRTTPVFLHGRRLDGLDGGPQRKRQIGSGPVSHRRAEGSFKVTLYSFGQNRKQGTLVFERATEGGALRDLSIFQVATTCVLVLIQLCRLFGDLGTRRDRHVRSPHNHANTLLPLPEIPTTPGSRGSSFFSESRWILWRTSSSPGVVTVPSAVLSRGLILPLLSPLPRIMRPDDANVAGNVHGGTILKMIEEAGAIISTRHCNSQSSERCVAALARVERTDFLSPVCIGEVAHVSAEITYTSKHSVEVQVNVMSENIVTAAGPGRRSVCSPQYSRQEQEQEGRRRYEAQKLERMGTKWRDGDIVQPVPNPEPNTVSYSQSSLIYLVGPSDCTLHGFVHGGVTMKLMDDVAGIVAARHCKTNIVTASVDAINFHDKIKKGERPLPRTRGGGGLRRPGPPAPALASARLPRETGSRSLVLCPVDASPRLRFADLTLQSGKMCHSGMIGAFILLETGINSSSEKAPRTDRRRGSSRTVASAPGGGGSTRPQPPVACLSAPRAVLALLLFPTQRSSPSDSGHTWEPGWRSAPRRSQEASRAGAGARGPRFCSISDLPVSVSDPQPETEDEKKRFEEGKGRYLQMKAKRQGTAEPQP